MSTPPENAIGRLRDGSRTSPAIFPASHQPPKQKKALMAAPAIASINGSDPARRAVSGARLAIVAWPETRAHPTSEPRTGTLSQLSVVITLLLKRVPK